MTAHNQKQLESKSKAPAAAPAKVFLRVKAINSESGISKDMLVEVRTGYTLFDAIYNTDSLKKAKVRKWNASVTQNVKSGTHEIKCDVKVNETANNDNNNNNNDKPIYSYSVNDLKITSTKQLFSLVGSSSDVLVTLSLRCAEKPKGNNKAGFDHSTLLNQSGNGGKMMKCPFSGMEFDEDALQEFLKHKNASS